MKTPKELRTEARSYLIEAEALRAEARRLEMEELAARTPVQPDLLGGSVVLTFTKYESGRIYTYAAVGWRIGRRQDRWAITTTVKSSGSDLYGRYTWSGLLSFIGEANWHTIARVTTVDYLLGDKDVPAVKETMGSYGKVKATENVEPWHGKAGPFGERDMKQNPISGGW